MATHSSILAWKIPQTEEPTPQQLNNNKVTNPRNPAVAETCPQMLQAPHPLTGAK